MAVLKLMKKKTIEEMHQVASERDGFCLSSDYIGAREPLLWRCKYGHEWSASPVNITSKNSWCPYCAGQRGDNFTISKMNQVAQQRGGKCLSTEFHNSKSKLQWQCSENHVWEATPTNVINKNSWCPYCAGVRMTPERKVLRNSPKREKKPIGYWNSLERCLGEASKYETKSEWMRGHPLSHRSASLNGWLDQCSTHMREIKKPDGYWTLALCKEEASRYSSKAEWRLSHKTSYSKANKEGWLDICCEHMAVTPLWFGPASILKFLLSHDIAYIAEHRFKGHPEVARRPFDFFLPDFNLVVEFHGEQHRVGWGRRSGDAEKIQARDLAKKAWAIENGINYLEIAQWSIGSKDDIYQLLSEKLLEISKSRDQIIRLKGRQLSDAESKRVITRIKWTLEACLEEAKKYTSRKEWQTLGAGSYQAAFKKGWLDECCSHMERKLAPRGFWTLERCIDDAKKYQTLKEWSAAKPSGYSVARSKNWVAKCTPHMTDGRKQSKKIIWTYEKCLELARVCKTKAEFKKLSGSAYLRARVNGWLNDCCSHME